MLQAVFLSILASLCSLCSPLIIQYALDHSIPNKNIPELLLMAGLLVITIALVVLFVTVRARIMTVVGQDIVVDIRSDLFAHLQELPFTYYDNRPHGKILVRVVQYVNNVCDLLSNGIINFFLELLNLIFITVFMFFVNGAAFPYCNCRSSSVPYRHDDFEAPSAESLAAVFKQKLQPKRLPSGIFERNEGYPDF